MYSPRLDSSTVRIRSQRQGLYNCGIARYSVQFTSGELSNADGVAWDGSSGAGGCRGKPGVTRVPVTNLTHFMCFFSLKWGGWVSPTNPYVLFSYLKDMISTWGGCFGGVPPFEETPIYPGLFLGVLYITGGVP